MRFQWVLLLGLACPLELGAGQVEEGVVYKHGGIYSLQLSVLLDAGRDAVFALVSDHAGLNRLSDVIVEVTLLEPVAPDSVRRRLLLHACIVVFCFKRPLVEEVTVQGNEWSTTVVPGQGAFRSGSGTWLLTAPDPQHSRIQVYYELEPDFWIPPVIGPWLIKRKMLGVAREAINKIESLAAAG